MVRPYHVSLEPICGQGTLTRTRWAECQVNYVDIVAETWPNYSLSHGNLTRARVCIFCPCADQVDYSKLVWTASLVSQFISREFCGRWDSLLVKISLQVSREGKNAIYCEACESCNAQTSQIIILCEESAIFAHNSALWPIAWNEFKSQISGQNQSYIRNSFR